MLRAGGGKIINIGSILSIFGAPYAPAYCASKGGSCKPRRCSLATAWAKDRIQADAVLSAGSTPEPTRHARAARSA